jgi:hypothetical protein
MKSLLLAAAIAAASILPAATSAEAKPLKPVECIGQVGLGHTVWVERGDGACFFFGKQAEAVLATCGEDGPCYIKGYGRHDVNNGDEKFFSVTRITAMKKLPSLPEAMITDRDHEWCFTKNSDEVMTKNCDDSSGPGIHIGHGYYDGGEFFCRLDKVTPLGAAYDVVATCESDEGNHHTVWTEQSTFKLESPDRLVVTTKGRP